MDTVELRDMMASSPPPELELKDDIIKLSMMGDEVAVKTLLDRGEITARWTDADGIGPLHVINPPPPPPRSTADRCSGPQSTIATPCASCS